MLLRVIRPAVPLLLLLAACGIYRGTMASTSPDPLRHLTGHGASGDRVPNVIAPRYDDPRVATDSQLVAVLDRMKPTLTPVDTNVLVHALRLWGPKAEFGDPRYPSGATMLRYFLDDAELRRLAGEKTPPLFMRADDGIRVRPWVETSPYRRTGSVHVDDLLATLGESGVPISTPLKMRNETSSVAELLRGAMGRFHRRQYEYEWSAISYARYLFPDTHWENRFGQPIDVDGMVDELIQQPMPNGVCGGTHRLEALVVLLRADDQYHALPPRTRWRIMKFMAHISQLLVDSQHAEGYWNRNWYLGSEAAAADKKNRSGDSVYDRILTTGHQMEWLSLAPPEVQPPRETIVRAGQWIVRAMLSEDAKALAVYYGPFSHAARSLCLWRSKDPYQAWREGMDKKKLNDEARMTKEIPNAKHVGN